VSGHSLDKFVARHRVIGIDSNILIAHFEQAADYAKSAGQLFQAFDQRGTQVALSTITIPEILIHPLRSGSHQLVQRYEQFIFRGQFIVAGITQIIARDAAEIGARSKLNSLDALIVASLIEAGATGFVTADQDFAAVAEIDVLILDPKKRRPRMRLIN
jgi:predicted nucleic acid-binding protein